MRGSRYAVFFLLALLSLLPACKSESESVPGAGIPEGCPTSGQTLELHSPPGNLFVKDIRFFTAIGENPLATAPEGKVFAIVRFVWEPKVAAVPAAPGAQPPAPGAPQPGVQPGQPPAPHANQPGAPAAAQPQAGAPQAPAVAGQPAAAVPPAGQPPAAQPGAPQPGAPAPGVAQAQPSPTGSMPQAGAQPPAPDQEQPLTPEQAAKKRAEALAALPKLPYEIVPPELKLADASGNAFPIDEEGVEAYRAMVEADPTALALPTEFTLVWTLDPKAAEGGIFLLTPEKGPDGTALRFCLGRHMIKMDD